MLRNSIRGATTRALIVTAVLGLGAGSAIAEGTVQKVSSTADGYCHLKIPAMRPSTLPNEKPELKSSNTGDVIDFYGPCNYDPTSKEEVSAQKRFRSIRWGKF